MSPLVWAYVGDCVYELFIRTYLIDTTKLNPHKLHIEAIKYAVCSGCKGLFTAHGSNFEDISLNPIIKNLIAEDILERIIFLDENIKGKVREAYSLNKKLGEYEKMVNKI